MHGKISKPNEVDAANWKLPLRWGGEVYEEKWETLIPVCISPVLVNLSLCQIELSRVTSFQFRIPSPVFRKRVGWSGS